MASPRQEKRCFRYAKWTNRLQTEKPYTIISDLPGVTEDQKSNMTFHEGPEELVTDIRGREKDFTLDDHGFMVGKQSFPDVDMSSAEAIATYQMEVEKFIKANVEGADKVIFFDHRVSARQIIDMRASSHPN
jgi:hypothetical protein